MIPRSLLVVCVFSFLSTVVLRIEDKPTKGGKKKGKAHLLPEIQPRAKSFVVVVAGLLGKHFVFIGFLLGSIASLFLNIASLSLHSASSTNYRSDPVKLAETWAKALLSDIGKLPSLKIKVEEVVSSDSIEFPPLVAKLKKLEDLSCTLEKAQVELTVLAESSQQVELTLLTEDSQGQEKRLDQVTRLIKAVKPTCAEFQLKCRLLRSTLAALHKRDHAWDEN
jgi:hypothetical protein